MGEAADLAAVRSRPKPGGSFLRWGERCGNMAIGLKLFGWLASRKERRGWQIVISRARH